MQLDPYPPKLLRYAPELSKTFILKKTDQIWRELTPESADFSFKIFEDTNDDHIFKAVCSHHDSPRGEKFTLYITEERKDENI